jgi:hypothetical protein
MYGVLVTVTSHFRLIGKERATGDVVTSSEIAGRKYKDLD